MGFAWVVMGELKQYRFVHSSVQFTLGGNQYTGLSANPHPCSSWIVSIGYLPIGATQSSFIAFGFSGRCFLIFSFDDFLI